ncbi:hypothetical protein NYY72_19170, partial [Acinetobacter baumannii]|nr:hypothetical protein [Acinetobacter baumannii]
AAELRAGAGFARRCAARGESGGPDAAGGPNRVDGEVRLGPERQALWAGHAVDGGQGRACRTGDDQPHDDVPPHAPARARLPGGDNRRTTV